MNSKIELIDNYLTKCDSCNKENAKTLIFEIVAVFGNEIKNITDNLDAYSWKKDYEKDFQKDLQYLRAQLLNHKINLENNLRFTEGTPSQIFNFTQTQNSNISINISFEQTINEIESLPENILPQDEKEQLELKLTKIQAEKDKSKLWEKAQSALKWIAEKGIEVGIAALPYIAEALKNAK